MELLDTRILLVTLSLTIAFYYITSENNIILRKDRK